MERLQYINLGVIHMKCSICGHDNTSAARFCANCGSVMDVKPQPSAAIERQKSQLPVSVKYVGFWERFVAALIDGIILSVVSAMFSFLFIPMAFGCGLFAFWIYHWLFTGIKGQTPGKMVLGIKVVDVNGDRPGLGTAALREIVGKTISTLGLLLGFLFIGISDTKRGWHDEIAGTFVTKVKTKETEERDYEVP